MSVRIYRPSKNAMQSGKRCDEWVLEFLPADGGFVDPVMGWKGSNDMRSSEVKLRFSSQEKAIEYAKGRGLHYTLTASQDGVLKNKSYSNNFMKY